MFEFPKEVWVTVAATGWGLSVLLAASFYAQHKLYGIARDVDESRADALKAISERLTHQRDFWRDAALRRLPKGARVDAKEEGTTNADK